MRKTIEELNVLVNTFTEDYLYILETAGFSEETEDVMLKKLDAFINLHNVVFNYLIKE